MRQAHDLFHLVNGGNQAATPTGDIIVLRVKRKSSID